LLPPFELLCGALLLCAGVHYVMEQLAASQLAEDRGKPRVKFPTSR
jgi:hypothetical protein